MADFTAKDIQALRHETGTGMMDAKKALQDTGGDLEKAKDLLRERGLAAAAKRTDRAQSQGIIGSYMHQQSGRPVIGVLVDLACETDFVAKTDGFAEAANDIAMHIAAARPGWIERDEVPSEVIEKERSLIAAQARNEGKPDHIVEKIVDGRINSFYKDHVLYDQQFVRTEQFDGSVGDMVKQLAAQLGENISVARFERLQVGETAE
ncbi:MAG: translation elongation factor Ts [Acidimicrobiia bacterium]|nr:translation elongation factor Ts [Acidimicrobiia bacterium]